MTMLPNPRRFTSDAATGAAYDHGAHVVEWTPAGHAPVLWMSGASRFSVDAPIRGGVPICLPWFGAGRSLDRTPAHGFARLRSWFVSETATTPQGTTVRYTFELAPTDAFPHTLLAEYVVSFGQELSLELTVTNAGSDAFTFEAALHTYIAVGDIRSVRVSGLDGCQYVDKAPGAASGPMTQHGDIEFTAETDRVYMSTGDVVISDPLLQRRIVVSKTNSANTVVWNPWVAKAAAMPDFGDDEWVGMLCVEGANALDDAITLAPGASHSMGYRMRVEAL